MEQKRDYDIWQPMLFAVVLSVGMFLGYKLSNHQNVNPFSYSTTNHLDALVKLISEKYVDSIDEKKLYRGGIDGILKTLDPHTVYIPSTELLRANEELEGIFYGIGVEFYLLRDTVTISAVIPGGPSAKKNIYAGDKILSIDDSLVAGKQYDEDEIIRRIRGQKNTNIALRLLHLNTVEEKVELARGNVPLRSVSAYFKVDENTGFIKIDMFSETTYREFHSALGDLTDQGIKKLIIDVRDNPGGYMDAVAQIADELVSGTHTIVSTRGRQKNDSLVTKENGLFETGSLCILVNENSASASEILAGAMQDLDRGTIIGRRTFGKGLVQEQFELPGKAAIRITTARYYLPSGRCIQRSYSNGKEKYRHDIIERFTNGELVEGDTSHKKTKEYFTTKKKIVYGDEGIHPTLFVPLDTIYHIQLNNYYSGHIAEEFTQRYFFDHKKEFESFGSLDKFHTGFKVNSQMQNELKLLLETRHINTSILANPEVYKEIDRSLRIQFARLLFGNNGKYKELYADDEFIKKAQEVMR